MQQLRHSATFPFEQLSLFRLRMARMNEEMRDSEGAFGSVGV